MLESQSRGEARDVQLMQSRAEEKGREGADSLQAVVAVEVQRGKKDQSFAVSEDTRRHSTGGSSAETGC